jgi:hypothetical protein
VAVGRQSTADGQWPVEDFWESFKNSKNLGANEWEMRKAKIELDWIGHWMYWLADECWQLERMYWKCSSYSTNQLFKYCCMYFVAFSGRQTPNGAQKLNHHPLLCCHCWLHCPGASPLFPSLFFAPFSASAAASLEIE